MKTLDVNNRFPTNYGSKQTAHDRSNTFVTIFIVLTLKRYWSICNEFAVGGLDWSSRTIKRVEFVGNTFKRENKYNEN